MNRIVRSSLSRAKRVAGGVLKSPTAYFGLASLLMLLPLRGRSELTTGSVLIAPPGAGNIGDRALVEAFVENTESPVTVIARAGSDYPGLERQREGVRIVALPSLLYGRFPNNVRDFVRLRRLLIGATSLAVCGADIMDGAYNHRASANRANMAALARKAGIDARILGFSWNGRSHPLARKALDRAARRGTSLLLRDPISFARAGEDGLVNRIESADMVFSARTVDPQVAGRILGDSSETDAPIAIVNVSGLLARSTDLLREHAGIVEDLASSGYRVLLLPHVVKRGSDDLAACRKVYGLVADTDQVTLVESTLAPAEIRALAAAAEVVVTGRMHLAVMSLMSGRLPVTLASQGKVEGLMRLFDADFLCVEPAPGVRDAVRRSLEQAKMSDLNDPIMFQSKLAVVRELSERNFDRSARIPGPTQSEMADSRD